jgi:aspartokinase-like uncharacterized kinase
MSSDSTSSIATALIKNKHLTELDVSGNSFDITRDAVLFFHALQMNPTIMVLTFHDEISDEANASPVVHRINAKLKENRECPPNELRSRFVAKIRDTYSDSRFVFH